MRFEINKMFLASGLRDLILYSLKNKNRNDQDCCSFNSYQNGREQGFQIYFKNSSVTITECRGSDGIVVYKDNHASQGLSEDSYKNAKYFGPGQFNETVEFCVNHLLS
jgi:hypothetical protein